MGNRSLKQVEKFIAVITIVIFVMLFFLKSPGSQFVQKAKSFFLPGTAVRCTSLQESTVRKGSNPTFLNIAKDLQLENETELFSPACASERNLRVCIQISNKGKTAAGNICLDVPLLGNLNSPYQTLLEESFSHKPLKIQETGFNNRVANFNIASLAPGKTETIILDYLIKTTPLKTNFPGYAPAALSAAEHKHDIEPEYLLPANKIESDHPEIAAKADQITGNLSNSLEKAEAIFKFVMKHMRYDLHSPHRNCGALAALRNGSGVCEDYASLFVALCRAKGIPARLVNGYCNPQGRGEAWNVAPGKVLSLTGYRHCWAEFYLGGWGWLPADPTLNSNNDKLTYFASLPQTSHLAQNYADQALRARFQGGQLGVTWEERLAGI